MKRFSLFFSVFAASALLVSCEPMDAVDPFGLIHDDDDDDSKSTAQVLEPSSDSRGSTSSRDSSESLTGKWSGKSATGQVSTKLSLVESGGSISGSLQWPGDRRSVSGSRSGNSVTLHIGGGDVWHLTVSGNKMSGSGDKAGTDRSYKLSFSR